MGKNIGYYWQIIIGLTKSRMMLPIRRSQLKKFGKHSYIEGQPNLSGGGRICIGDHVYIEKNAKLWAVRKYNQSSYNPNLSIGDFTRIAQNFHCTCAERVEIGKGVSITANCGIFDIIHPYDDINVNPRFADIKTAPVVIGDDCMIGMNSTILPGTHLGKHCVVGANSVVSGEFPDYCVIVGAPCRIVKRFDFDKQVWVKLSSND